MTSVPRALSLRTGVHDDSVMKEMARMSAVTSAVLLADEHPLCSSFLAGGGVGAPGTGTTDPSGRGNFAGCTLH